MALRKRVLITGGAGFIGSNLSNRLINQGYEVVIFDNLSRAGSDSNIDWLRDNHGENGFQLIVGDVTDYGSISEASKGVDCVFHLAAQVAVTTSVNDPRHDFISNAMGTFNTLEAARKYGNNPIFIYSSTNKVYGEMKDVKIGYTKTRYYYAGLPFGIGETQPLDFHSPYGCSKGAADQYVHDYARIYGLRTVVARQSCIYGTRQFGIEDQGWVAWFIIAGLQGKPITIYGDGKQVRDILFIDDLISFYLFAMEKIEITAGQIYNIGGGPNNTISVWGEFGSILEGLFGFPMPVRYADWRAGDQLVYVSDIRKAERDLNWKPQISARQGIERLYDWANDHQDLFNNRNKT